MQFTIRDLVEVRDRAVQNIIKAPSRSRLPGMNRDLTIEDNRVLAFYNASITTAFSRAGIPIPQAILDQMPAPFTASQEPVEGYDAVPTAPTSK